MSKPEKFCPAPWMSISTDVNGSIRPCCRFAQHTRQTKHVMPWMKDGNLTEVYNSPQMKKLRKAFLDGEMPPECKWCWDEEDLGIESFRERYIKRGYEYDEENPIPQVLDFKLNNVCNLKCRMCGPTASSSIAKERGGGDPYWLENKIIDTKNEEVFFKEWMPHIKELEMTGGEPFFSSENKKILNRMVDEGLAENVKLLLTTNAMFYIPKLLDKLKSFKRVQLALSIDDVGDRLEYARSGASWKTIKTNVENLRKNYPEFHIDIYRTINMFNIFHLNELDDWGMENGIRVTSGLLHEPEHLCIKYLPTSAKSKVNEKFKGSNSYVDVLNFMNDRVSILDSAKHIVWFWKETDYLDGIRKTSFEDTFPEWYDHLLK